MNLFNNDLTTKYIILRNLCKLDLRIDLYILKNDTI